MGYAGLKFQKESHVVAFEVLVVEVVELVRLPMVLKSRMPRRRSDRRVDQIESKEERGCWDVKGQGAAAHFAKKIIKIKSQCKNVDR